MNVVGAANRGVSMLRPACTYCRHCFANRGCAAFHDGCPLAIRHGKGTHQAAHPCDGGILLAPIPSATVTTPQVTEGDQVLWPLIGQEEARSPQPV